MKKLILLMILLISMSFVQTQTKFEQGFNKGYPAGYCYQLPNCISPNTPNPPAPNVNESDDSYQDGYNRGFTKGKEDKNK